jgi:hypothetical protein
MSSSGSVGDGEINFFLYSHKTANSLTNPLRFHLKTPSEISSSGKAPTLSNIWNSDIFHHFRWQFYSYKIKKL